jgi:uncharacterized phage protein gp47/JayE
MAFTPRTFDSILADMIAYVRSNTAISDFTVGSVIRTVLEAAALEDDEQYFQMVQLLDLFSITTARGENLDRRMADYGITRRAPQYATARVQFLDKNLVTDQVAIDQASGSTTIQLFDTSGFPTAGYPYIVRLAESTTKVQDVLITNNNTTTNVFTLDATTPLTNDMIVGDRGSLVTGATSRLVPIGTNVQAPSTFTDPVRVFATQEPAVIVAGNLYSNSVIAKSTQSGTRSNVGAGKISQFSGAPPFTGALVTNGTASAGGADRETDRQFRSRGVEVLQSLSRGTPLAVKNLVVGAEDPATGQRVTSASVLEDFVNNEVIVYIDDGTGFVADKVSLPADSLALAVIAGQTTLDLSNVEDFPSSGLLLLENTTAADRELVAYSSKDNATNVLTLSSALANGHPAGTIVSVVQQVTASAESGQQRFSLQNFPVVRGTDRVFLKEPGSSWRQLTSGTDYVLNKGNGEFAVTSLAGAAIGAEIVAQYAYYTNLALVAQLTLEGSKTNEGLYPGVKAAGIMLSVEAPVLKRVTVTATISAQSGFAETDLSPLVKQNMQNYVNSLNIGEDLVRTKLIDVAYDVPGVGDVTIVQPTSNLIVLENEIAIPFDASGASLVTVS